MVDGASVPELLSLSLWDVQCCPQALVHTLTLPAHCFPSHLQSCVFSAVGNQLSSESAAA